MKRKLLLLYLRVILDSRFIALRRRLTELRRQLTLKKRVVHVFLQLDDPYSYLLSQYLEHVITHYRSVEFRFYLCQALRGDFMPQPDMLAEYSVTDCRMLAMELGVPFLDRRETQTVEYRRPLLDFLAGEQEDENFGSVITRALAFYWRGDADGAAGMLGKIRPEQAVANVQVGRNQLLLRKMGHYSCATMHYAGEWYWGVDRLPYLIDRLDQQGLKRYREAAPELESLARTMRSNPPARAPAKARELPPLEMFYSFRSPYSYIALARVFEIADSFGLKLIVRPVLPMVMRGLKVPGNKLLYIVHDANREAKRLAVPFGKISDAVGIASERCIAVFYHAQAEGKEREFLSAVGEAIWSQAIDVASDEGMQIVAERADLSWTEVQEAMANNTWRDTVEENRRLLTENGLWGVPSFRIGELALWGQDRTWLLARKIAEMCDDGEGIVT